MEDNIKTRDSQAEQDVEHVALVQAVKYQEQINHHLKQLSLESLRTIADFVGYLANQESEEATQELEEIPGFAESFARGKQDILEGRTTPVENLKRKY